MKSLSLAAGISVILALLVGCAPATITTSVTAYRAPEDAALLDLKKIALAPFREDKSEQFVRELESSFANAKMLDKDFQNKNVVEIVGLEKTRPLNISGNWDDAQMAKVASQLGVDAVVGGEVVTWTNEIATVRKTEFGCVREGTQRGKDGKLETYCVTWGDIPYSCVQSNATVKVNFRVVSRAGRVISRRSAEGIQNETVCKGAPATVPRLMIERAVKMAALDLRSKIVATSTQMQVQLSPDSEGIASSQAKEKFASALAFSKANRMDRACEIFRDIYQQEQKSAGLHYNVGVCDEIDGNLQEAGTKYRIADRLLSSPNQLISDALTRTKNQASAINTIASKRGDLVDTVALKNQQRPNVVNPIVNNEAIPPALIAQMKNERRVALVLGNGQYREIGALRNTVNDSNAIKKELENVGFTVIQKNETTRKEMKLALSEFQKNLKPGSVALVFFAGHGIAANTKDESYLLPVDFKKPAKLTDKDLDSYAVSTGEIRKAVESMKPRVAMYVFDACRVIPQIAASSRSASTTGLKLPKMLAQGVLISFSAGEGQAADDGEGQNGLYTSKLIEAMRIPNQSASDVFKYLQAQVAIASNGEQKPEVRDQLTGQFFFTVQQ